MNRGIWLALIILLLPVAAGADHGPPTWLFTGTVSSVNDSGGHLGVAVDDPASGRIVWYTSMSQIFDGGTVAYYQETAGEVIGVRLSLGGVAYTPNSSANMTLQVHNDHTTFDDRFSLSDAAVTNTAGLTYSASGLSLVLSDTDSTVFSSTAIPVGLPPLSEFESATVSLTLTNVNGTSDSANVMIDLLSLEEEVHAQPVPALSPAAMTLLVSMLAWAGVTRLRRA